MLLIVHHTPSPAMHAMLAAIKEGATHPDLDGVEVVVKAALEATASDVLAARGYVLGSPVNLGYISGALKHFFDTVYYPCIESTVGRPFGLYLHGNSDAAGALRAVESITTGLRWKRVADDVVVIGEVGRAELEACVNLGGTVGAYVLG